ncbi:MAG: 3-phosphoshikimate 1-carboxyvinyltransferase [Planctomycetota bacterium]|nr:MAG: 3-phosphoshikimate 1-carboxyvinyltransferase [Planctomycetota bacterium]REK38465.1 MAG: 3-phosphoshikimate 1-carboxyvinyltransferase [Planctomycetota bacterium]
MKSALAIEPVTTPIRGTIQPPGSKSITNRALVCAALADGSSRLAGALASEDTEVMIAALRALGIDIQVDPEARAVEVQGCAGMIPATSADLYVANSGTTIRFLTALVALGHGTFRLDGKPRMRERPIGDLIDGLAQLGAGAHYEDHEHCPPVVIEADGLRGGNVRMRGDVSSQYLSGLLMALPYAATDARLEIEGPLVSRPYVAMTMAVMRQFGAEVEEERAGTFRVSAAARYRGQPFAIEPDASAASYFWAAAAITQGTVTVTGLSRESLQGDVRFCECLSRMGCLVDYGSDQITVTGGPLRGIATDMSEISDTVQTLAAVALFAKGPTTITGVGHIRHKETDRIGDLANELRRLGATVEELADGLRIVPGELRPARIQTYDDHRMAMSLAVVGLQSPGISIEDPDCTAKTYPDFFADLDRLCGRGSTD